MSLWKRAPRVGLVVAGLCLLVQPAVAEVRVGPLLDLNIATLSIDDEEMRGVKISSTSRLGAGLRLSFDLGERLALDLSPMYLGKGFDFDFPAGVEETDRGTGRYGYVELPVELRYSLAVGGVRPYLLAGPRIAVLTSARGDLQLVDGTTEEEDIKDLTNSLDAGIALGAGLELAIGERGRGFVEGLYAFGLTNIDDGSPDSDAIWGHRGAQVRAGVTFSVGR